ncbi:MAG: helix-turn-helix domain-containing protein [Thermoplasmatota archaeon]
MKRGRISGFDFQQPVRTMVYELEIAIPENQNWWGVITSRISVPVRLMDMSLDRKGRVQNLVEIEIGDIQPIRVMNTLIGLEELESFSVSEVVHGKIVVILGESKDSIGSFILRSGCFFRSIRRDGNRIIWNLIAPQKANARELSETLLSNRVDFDLVRLVPLSGDEKGLTPRQEQILKIALEGGYFDKPKGIGVREIADELDISTATVSETLRRAVKQLLEQSFAH